MSKKKIAENLKRALIEDARLSAAAFENELREHIEEYIESKHEDNDHYFIAIAEQSNQIAMLLLDGDDTVHINEDARALLRTLWRDAYTSNIQRLIPDMAKELAAGYLSVMGVKVVDQSKES
jgi:hypothetical protein